MKLSEKLWNEANLEGSHNYYCGLDSHMTPEEFAKEYGIPNAFVVPFKGNIVPPFDKMADRFSCLRELKWAVIGDSSSDIPDDELGYTEEIIRVAKTHPNITGAEVDDFFILPERMKRFTPEVMKKIKKRLNDNGLDFWCVLYERELDLNIEEYIDCFDGFSFWVWGCQKQVNLPQYLDKFFKLTKGKRVMMGMYLWDYAICDPANNDTNHPMDAVLFEEQLKLYIDMLRKKDIEGIIFCASTVGDSGSEANRILKEYVQKYGDIEIE